MNAINSTLSYLYRLLFPPVCAGCSTSGSAFCGSCFKKLRRATLVPVKHGMALYPYKDTSIKTILWEAKYHHNTRALEALISRSTPDILEYISEYTLSEEATMLVFIPIPTSTVRKRARGYNLPTIIAKILAQQTHGVVLPLLSKIRETIPQSKTKSREVRLQNVAHSLAVRTEVPIPPHALLILIDDIITSGATAAEAQRALKKEGYDAIVIAVAHGS